MIGPGFGYDVEVEGHAVGEGIEGHHVVLAAEVHAFVPACGQVILELLRELDFHGDVGLQSLDDAVNAGAQDCVGRIAGCD